MSGIMEIAVRLLDIATILSEDNEFDEYVPPLGCNAKYRAI
jgi:hypothetical protein